MISSTPTRMGIPGSSESWTLGCLALSHGALGRRIPPRQGADLIIPTGVPLSLHHGNLQRILRPPLDLLYLPAKAHPLRTSELHGWRISLDPLDLCQKASELCGHRLSPARFSRRLQAGRAIQPRQSPQRELMETLLQLLQLVSSESLRGDPQLELVGLDRTIVRSVTLLLCGDLIQVALQRQESERGSRSLIFEELVHWIEANLDRSIQLSDLVKQSGYSQRSLRNFFQERFGCGPVHWIRNRRLERARARLLSPEPFDTVSTIAASVGYPHLSQFSRDFQKAYSTRPSELLREGHRHQNSRI